MLTLIRACLVVLVAVCGWYCLLYLPHTELADFSVYREAARALLGGKDMYAAQFEVTQRDAPLSLGYLYPPLLAVVLSWGELLAPSLLPFLWCGLLFLTVVGSGILFGGLLRHLFQGPAESPERVQAGAFLLLLLWPPLWDGLMWGQVNPIVLFAILAACGATLKGQTAASGAWIALAAALKATPAVLLIPFIAGKSWRGIAGFMVGSLIVVLLSGASPRGYQVLGDFVGALQSFSSSPLSIDPFYDYSLSKFLGDTAGKVVSLGLIPLYAVVVYRQLRRGGGESLVAQQMILGLPLMVLLSPCVWFHHLLWIVPGIGFAVLLAEREGRGILRGLVIVGAVLLGSSLYAHVVVRHHLGWGEEVVKGTVPLLLLALTGVTVFLMKRGYVSKNL